jgi:hypothetical protein
MLAWAALGLLALPGVSRAESIVRDWTATGTNTWTSTSWCDLVGEGDVGTVYGTDGDGLLTVERYFTLGVTSSDGILNQTGGTITTSGEGGIIGQVMREGGVTATYDMSGAAQFNGGTGAVILLNQAEDSAAVGTWSLTDTASATMGQLQIGQADQPTGSRYLLLSGAATFTATSLAFNNTGTTAGNMNYISFAPGSTATFTAGDITANGAASSYEALVTAGNIRVDGVAADFSAFQVTGNTLSLAATGGGGYTEWADANGVTGGPNGDSDNDGMDNGVEYFMGITASDPVFTANPGLDGTNTVTWPKDPAYKGTWQVQTSPDLGTWTDVAGTEAGDGTSVTYQLLPGALGGKIFVRLVVTPNN